MNRAVVCIYASAFSYCVVVSKYASTYCNLYLSTYVLCIYARCAVFAVQRNVCRGRASAKECMARESEGERCMNLYTTLYL